MEYFILFTCTLIALVLLFDLFKPPNYPVSVI